MCPTTPALTPHQALMFAGYTAAEIADAIEVLTPREVVALAATEARALGAWVAVTAAQIGASCARAAAAYARRVGAVLRCPPSRRRRRVDVKGYVCGVSKPRGWGVLPTEVRDADRVGAARQGL